jgi:hypothetical protein
MSRIDPDAYCVVPRSAIPAEEWDDFALRQSDEAWLWHLADFQDVMIERGLEDLSFALRAKPGGEILAVMPLHRRRRLELHLFRWFTAHSHGGPALRNGVGERQRGKILATIQAYLQATARQHLLTEITIAVPPVAQAYRGAHCPRVNPLLQLGCECNTEPAWMVSLIPTMEDIRRAYSYQTRSDLRKAHDYTIHEAQDESELEKYYQLHIETCRRTEDIPHPFEYFKMIFKRFLANRRCRILFYIKDGQILSAQCTGLLKGGANYWFGSSITAKPQHGGENRVLFDRQFELAREEGNEWYFMGGAVLQGSLVGISNFKGSFGSQLYPYYHGRIVYNLQRRRFFTHLELITGYSE